MFKQEKVQLINIKESDKNQLRMSPNSIYLNTVCLIPATFNLLLLTFYQLPNTIYQLPTYPIYNPLLFKKLDYNRNQNIIAIFGVNKSYSAVYWLFQSNISQLRGLLKLSPATPKKIIVIKIRLDKQNPCGYIYNMKDRNRELNKMVHIRFTDDERKQLKAISALDGKSIQEYVRALVLKNIDKKRIK